MFIAKLSVYGFIKEHCRPNGPLWSFLWTWVSSLCFNCIVATHCFIALQYLVALIFVWAHKNKSVDQAENHLHNKYTAAMRRGIYFINITVPYMNIHVTRDINRDAAVGFDEMEFQFNFKGDTSRVYLNVRICMRCFWRNALLTLQPSPLLS